MADTPVNNQFDPPGAWVNRRTWLAAALLAVMGVVFVSLGNWQLNRADERREIAAMIEAGRRAAPVELTTAVDATALEPWRSAQATGHWLPAYSVLLDNRNLDGKPGFWLATPLSLAPDTAVLVLRGWVARPIGNFNPFPAVTQDKAAVTLTGELVLRVPQLYEIADEAPLEFTNGTSVKNEGVFTRLDLNELPQRQNVSIAEMSEITGIKFLPVVLMQTSANDGTEMQRQWPTPSIDSNTNMGYAMQWFGFAAIAFGAMGVLLWKTWRRAKIYR